MTDERNRIRHERCRTGHRLDDGAYYRDPATGVKVCIACQESAPERQRTASLRWRRRAIGGGRTAGDDDDHEDEEGRCDRTTDGGTESGH